MLCDRLQLKTVLVIICATAEILFIHEAENAIRLRNHLKRALMRSSVCHGDVIEILNEPVCWLKFASRGFQSAAATPTMDCIEFRWLFDLEVMIIKSSTCFELRWLWEICQNEFLFPQVFLLFPGNSV